MADVDIIDSMFFAMTKIWQNACQSGIEPVKIRRGYREIDLGEWKIRKYVWGSKIRFEVDNNIEQSFIERVGDTYRRHGSWDVLQMFLNWSENEGLM